MTPPGAELAAVSATAGEPLGVMTVLRSLSPGATLLPGWSAAKVADHVQSEAHRLTHTFGLGAGELCVVRGESLTQLVLDILTIINAGCCVFPVDKEVPDMEIERLTNGIGTLHPLVSGETRVRRLVASPVASHAMTGVLLSTSGVTGEPKLVVRSEQSLWAEAVRYRRGLGLSEGDRIVLPLPITHAYALGWLFAGLIAGAEVELLGHQELAATARRIREGATIAVLSPTLARLLARRSVVPGPAGPALRFAMVGAGPVDDALEQAFLDKFGVGLARNYGTTETGALFAGLPPLPGRCVGHPLPGIRCRLDPGDAGQLHVCVEEGAWQPTGDLATLDSEGRLTLLGRLHESIRRGDRWVSPREVETVLKRHPAVQDVHVKKVSTKYEGNERIVATVVPRFPDRFRVEDLLEHARAQLSAHKVPDEVRVRTTLRRNALGKVVALPRYRRAASSALLSTSRAYKATELLFALKDLGVLDLLDGTRDVDELSGELGLDPDALSLALDCAEKLGLVERGLATDNAPDLSALLALESRLSRSLCTREEIVAVVRNGLHSRPFEAIGPDEALKDLYAAAMFGVAARHRALHGLRFSGVFRKTERGRIRLLEVTVGPGVYAEVFVEHVFEGHAELVQLGDLTTKPRPAVERAEKQGRATVTTTPTQGPVDLCVLSNSVHRLGPELLADLRNLVLPRGAILIDDIFLPTVGNGAEFGVDWLTHGGVHAWTLSETRGYFAALGADVAVRDVPDDPFHKLVLMTWEH